MAIGIIALPISLAHNTTSQKRVHLLEREVFSKKLGGVIIPLYILKDNKTSQLLKIIIEKYTIYTKRAENQIDSLPFHIKRTLTHN